MKQVAVVLVSPYSVSRSGGLEIILECLERNNTCVRKRNIPNLEEGIIDSYFEPYTHHDWLEDMGRQIKYRNRNCGSLIRKASPIELGQKLIFCLKQELSSGNLLALLFIAPEANDLLRRQIGFKLDPLRYPPDALRHQLPWDRYFDFEQKDPWQSCPGRLIYTSEKERGLADATLFFSQEIKQNYPELLRGKNV